MEDLNMINEAYWFASCALVANSGGARSGQEHVEHFSSRFVITEKSPAFWPDYCF